MTIYRRREFGHADIQTIKYMVEQDASLKRAPLSRKLCELFDWTKPNGELKDMTCRMALLPMQADGLSGMVPITPRDRRRHRRLAASLLRRASAPITSSSSNISPSQNQPSQTFK